MLVVYKEIDALFQEVKGFRFVPRVGRNPYNQNALSVSTNLYQWFSDLPHAYPFSKNHWNPLKAHAFPPKLAELRKKVETSQNSPFNSVLVNYYPDGNAKLSAHSDNDPWLGPIFDVPSVSIGASRKILFRPKSKNVTIPTSWNGRKVFEVDMKSGSLLAMKGKFTQANFTHEIPAKKRSAGARVNFTFRNVHEDLVHHQYQATGGGHTSPTAEFIADYLVVKYGDVASHCQFTRERQRIQEDNTTYLTKMKAEMVELRTNNKKSKKRKIAMLEDQRTRVDQPINLHVS